MAIKKNKSKKKSTGKKRRKEQRTSDKMPLNTILTGDCIKLMSELPDGCIDLTFADPPFNIGYKYDVYDDRKSVDEYLEWSKEWMSEVYRLLKDDGAFWLAIGDDFAAELKILARDIGFHTRNWVIWYYTFGVHCESKFTRSHTHLLYFVKDPKKFTFNRDAIAVPSARQLVYNDARANPKGRVPDDTWILRPQDCQDGFDPDETCWYFPRVAGTFKERAGFHGCQMPEQLLGRIIRCCSRAGETVFDPFSGSASTSVVAKKLHRNFLSMELSEEYASKGFERVEAVEPGDPLVGADEPKLSAPVTYPVKDGSTRRADSKSRISSVADFEKKIIEAFKETCQGYSTDRLLVDPKLNSDFIECCKLKSIEGAPADLNRYLLKLRKSGKLSASGFKTEKIYKNDWSELDKYIDASEIAWKLMSEKYGLSLDGLLFDPLIASEFDRVADSYAPGFEPVQYRWAAMTLRKKSRDARKKAKQLIIKRNSTSVRRSSAYPVNDLDWDIFKNKPGIYLIEDGKKQVYVGETLDLKERLMRSFASESEVRETWNKHGKSLKIRLAAIDITDIENTSKVSSELFGYQSFMVDKWLPALNALHLTAS